jgi:hypothetical protein
LFEGFDGNLALLVRVPEGDFGLSEVPTRFFEAPKMETEKFVIKIYYS